MRRLTPGAHPPSNPRGPVSRHQRAAFVKAGHRPCKAVTAPGSRNIRGPMSTRGGAPDTRLHTIFSGYRAPPSADDLRLPTALLASPHIWAPMVDTTYGASAIASRYTGDYGYPSREDLPGKSYHRAPAYNRQVISGYELPTTHTTYPKAQTLTRGGEENRKAPHTETGQHSGTPKERTSSMTHKLQPCHYQSDGVSTTPKTGPGDPSTTIVSVLTALSSGAERMPTNSHSSPQRVHCSGSLSSCIKPLEPHFGHRGVMSVPQNRVEQGRADRRASRPTTPTSR